MSVVVEAFTLVSRRETIERAYPGGAFGFRLDFPDSFAADEHLLRMGSTDPSQVRVTVDRLQELGVQYASRYEYLEMAVVLQGVGTSAGCSWLRFERRDDCSVCWLEGEEEGTLATPPGWTPERSRGWDEWTAGDPSRFIPVEIVTDPLGLADLEPYFGGPRMSGVPFEDGTELRRMLARAQNLEREGRGDELPNLYSRAASLNPRDAELAFRAGAVLDVAGRHDEAIASLDRAIELDPGHSSALACKGTMLNKLGRREDGIALLQRAVEVGPENRLAWWNKAATERDADLLDEARLSYERFLLLAGDNPGFADKTRYAREWLDDHGW
jgi:tetratricopeptide (TPR) repeat protein